MAPLTYHPYDPTSAGVTIGDLILRGADVQSRLAQQIADASARGQMATGQAWASAVQNIGQIPGQILADRRIEADAAQNRALKQQQINSGAEAEAERRRQSTVMTVGNLARGAETPEDFARSVQGLVDLKALDPTVAAHITQTVTQGGADAWPAIKGQYVGFMRQYLKPEKLGADDALIDPITQQPIATNPKTVVLPRPGSVAVRDGQTIATAPVEPPKPVGVDTVDENGKPVHTFVTPTAGLSVPIAPKPVTPKSRQAEWGLIDGKPVAISFDPETGKRFDANGNDVTATVKPIPPASVQIQQTAQAAVSTLPDWAQDASRPIGPEGNRMDPKIRLTPNGLYQAAQTHIATGQYPPTGRGNDPAAQATRAAVNAKVGAIAAEAGMDVPTLRAFYKSNAASLAQLQKSSDAAQAFMATADKNVPVLEATFKKLTDTGSPLLNQPFRALQGKVLGSPDQAAFVTALQSVRNEYSRIISQNNLNIMLSDSARHEGGTLLSDDATIPQMMAALGVLKQEGNNRLLSQGEQIQRVMGRLQGAPGGTANAAPGTTTAPAQFRFNPATGKLEPVK